jgi:oligopeptide transport system ATP-binding protein
VSAVIEARGLAVRYQVRGRDFRALEAITLSIGAGEALGVVGESGAGKSTLARALLGLVAPGSGQVLWLGQDLATLAPEARRRLRRHVSVVFQDPVASLDPRFTVAASVAEPLGVHSPTLGPAARARAVEAMLERVGLAATLGRRYPHELSGGQCQRVAIARAMITRPQLLICDEPLSALDVSVQAQIVNLLDELRREEGTALLVISHNLAVVRQLCSRLLVLYLGRVMEEGPCATLLARPGHPYTRLLLDSVPVFGAWPRRAALTAEEPASPFAPPSGCVFRNRCRHAEDACAAEVPSLEALAAGQRVACRRAAEGVASPAGGAVSPARR